MVATAIGRALAGSQDNRQSFFNHLMDGLCYLFRQDNPRFDSARFWAYIEAEREEWEKEG